MTTVKITLCRELTKKYEEAHRTTIHEVLDYYKDKRTLGEYVLVLEGKTKEQVEEERKKRGKPYVRGTYAGL